MVAGGAASGASGGSGAGGCGALGTGPHPRFFAGTGTGTGTGAGAGAGAVFHPIFSTLFPTLFFIILICARGQAAVRIIVRWLYPPNPAAYARQVFFPFFFPPQAHLASWQRHSSCKR